MYTVKWSTLPSKPYSAAEEDLIVRCKEANPGSQVLIAPKRGVRRWTDPQLLADKKAKGLPTAGKENRKDVQVEVNPLVPAIISPDGRQLEETGAFWYGKFAILLRPKALAGSTAPETEDLSAWSET